MSARGVSCLAFPSSSSYRTGSGQVVSGRILTVLIGTTALIFRPYQHVDVGRVAGDLEEALAHQRLHGMLDVGMMLLGDADRQHPRHAARREPAAIRQQFRRYRRHV